MEGVRTGVADRNGQGVGRGEVRVVTLGATGAVVGTLFLQPGVVAHAPVDTEVAQAPIDVQVRTHAEVATPVASAPAGVLLDGSLLFVVALVLQVIDVGGLPVDDDVAEGELRQAVLDAQIVTSGFLVTTVDQRAGDVGHLGAILRIAGDTITRVGVAQNVALVEDRGNRLGRDHVVDADLPPVQADVQALYEVRAVHQADGPGLGGFRQQFGIGAGQVGVVGLRPRASGIDTAGCFLAEVGRDGTGAARGNLRVTYRGTEQGVAWIGVFVEGLRGAAVQVSHRRRTEARGVGTAHQQVIDRLPLQAELAVEGVAEGVVIRITAGHVDRQFLGERQVGQDRHVQLEEELVELVATGGGRTGQVGAQARLQQRIRVVFGLLFAVLVACCKRQVTGRQGEQRAGQVGAVDLGGGQRRVVSRQEEILLQIRVGQRTSAVDAITKQRVPRGATGDDRTRGTTVSNAVLDERRADGILHVRDEQVAGAGLGALVTVVDVTDIPVEVLIAELERAFQAGREAEGIQLGLGLARHFPGATHEVDILVQRVERTVLGQLGAIRAGAVRVTGDLLQRLAFCIQNVGGTADVVGEIVLAVGEHRATLDPGRQIHLLRRVGQVGVGQLMVVGKIGRIGARVHDVVLAAVDQYALLGDRRPAVGVIFGRERMTWAVGIGAEAAVLGQHRLLVAVLGTQGQRATVVGHAVDEVVGFLVTVALAVLAAVDAGFQAIEVLAGDDVDHAGNGIGAVDGRCAVGQHFHALDDRGRDRGQIGVTAGADAHALAVQQYQGALRAEVAQVNVLAADFFARAQGIGAADRRRAGCRQVLHDVGNAGEALLFNVGALQRDDRLRGFHARLADARTGDRNAVQVGRAAGSCVLRRSERRCQGKRNAGRQQAEPHCRNTNVHQSLQGTC